MGGYTSFPFQSFGEGLNLQAKPDAISPAECIDALNVVFTDRGAIEQRPGYSALTGALTNRVDSLQPFYTASGTRQLLAGAGTRLEALNTSGEVVASATGLTEGPYGFARVGTPNSEAVYAGNGTDTIRKWNGSAWSAPTATVDGAGGKAMPKARYLAVMPGGNRLVATGYSTTTGGPNGTTSSPSHVYFSEQGNPEAWMTEGTEAHPANNDQLTPGDGEKIQGAIAWGEFVFVFKETKFFVYTGISTDSQGNPVFNYRTIDTGVGLASPRALCADASGVYFMSRQGVHRTTGQGPQLVSGPVEPIWAGNASTFYTGGTLAHSAITECALTTHDGRIYLSYPTETVNSRTLVYDPEAKWWSLYSFPCSALASFRIGSAQELVFGYASGENKVGHHNLELTNDAGAAILSHWRSGWFDLNSPDIKTIRSQKVWGTGRVNMALGYDFRRSVGKTLELNLEDTSAPQWGKTEWGASEWAQPRGLNATSRRIATRGTVFSAYLSNEVLNQFWSVHRIDHQLRETRRPAPVNT